MTETETVRDLFTKITVRTENSKLRVLLGAETDDISVVNKNKYPKVLSDDKVNQKS